MQIGDCVNKMPPGQPWLRNKFEIVREQCAAHNLDPFWVYFDWGSIKPSVHDMRPWIVKTELLKMTTWTKAQRRTARLRAQLNGHAPWSDELFQEWFDKYGEDIRHLKRLGEI